VNMKKLLIILSVFIALSPCVVCSMDVKFDEIKTEKKNESLLTIMSNEEIVNPSLLKEDSGEDESDSEYESDTEFNELLATSKRIKEKNRKLQLALQISGDVNQEILAEKNNKIRQLEGDKKLLACAASVACPCALLGCLYCGWEAVGIISYLFG